MVFLLVLLLFALGFGLMIALLRLSLYWLQKQTARHFENRFGEANEIIRWGRAPEPWVRTYRQRIDHMRRTDKSHLAIQRLGARAQKDCLRRLRSLVKFLENGRFYDSLETRTMMVDALWAVHNQWAASSWEILLGPPAERTEITRGIFLSVFF
jgi:hypothetical protein